MIVSGGALVKKSSDIVLWRGNTTQFDGRALDILGVWSAYHALYEKQPWVSAAVNKIANSTARLPLKVYRRTADGREDARNTPYGKLLAKPSPKIPSFAFWFWVSAMKDTYGESFLGKVRDAGGRPVALVPLHPIAMQYDDETGTWSYDDGKRRRDNIPRRDLIHFRHFNPSSVRGLSPLEPLRSTLENEEGARRANSALWRNGGRPSVALEHPGELSTLAQERLAISWNQVHGGVDNWAKALVLEEGMKANVLPLNVEELQYIEARKLNREEVCGVYDIPPPALHILDRATYSNITEQNRALYRDTMAPKLGDLESTLELELRDGSMGVTEPDFPDNVYAEFLMDEVLRGAFEARATAYQQSDFMTIAEKRQKENLPFIPGTDRIFLNSASLPLGPDGQLEQPEPAEQPEPPPLPAPEPVAQRSLSNDTIRTLMGRLSRTKTIDEVDPTVFAAGIGDAAPVLKALAEAQRDCLTVDAFKAKLKGVTTEPATETTQPVFISHTVVNPEKEIPATVVENTVNVEQPQVTVEAAQVNVPAPEVNVHVPEQRAVRRVVERDENGRIVALIDTFV